MLRRIDSLPDAGAWESVMLIGVLKICDDGLASNCLPRKVAHCRCCRWETEDFVSVDVDFPETPCIVCPCGQRNSVRLARQGKALLFCLPLASTVVEEDLVI